MGLPAPLMLLYSGTFWKVTYILLNINEPVLQFEELSSGFPLLRLPFLPHRPDRALSLCILGALGVGRLLFLSLPQSFQSLLHLRGKDVLFSNAALNYIY